MIDIFIIIYGSLSILACLIIGYVIYSPEKVEVKPTNKDTDRVAKLLEEWIIRHEKFMKEEPFMIYNNTTYNMKELLSEIKQNTPLGIEIVESIINTAITLLYVRSNDLTNIKHEP